VEGRRGWSCGRKKIEEEGEEHCCN